MLTESHDMTPKHAKQVLDHTWRDTPENMKIKLTADLPKLFSRLKNQGVKVSNLEKTESPVLKTLHWKCTRIILWTFSTSDL